MEAEPTCVQCGQVIRDGELIELGDGLQHADNLCVAPVQQLVAQYQPPDFGPLTYITGSMSVIESLGWFEPDVTVQSVIRRTYDIVNEMYDQGIDASNYPYGLLWGLSSSGLIREVPGLKDQLVHWFEVCSTAGDDVSYLPEL